MKILYIITRADLGGAQKHLLKIAGGVAGQAQLALVCGEEGRLTNQAAEMGIPIFIARDLVRPIHPIKDAKAFVQLRRMIRDWSPDLVHCHSSKAGLLGRFAARLEGVPSVFTAHGWAFAEGVDFKRKVMSVSCEWVGGLFSDHIIVASEYERELGLSYRAASPNQIHVVYEGTADSAPVAQPGRGDTPTIIMVARFSEQKDHVSLLRALAGVRAPYDLCLVGEGPQHEDMRLLAKQLGISSSVRFLGTRTDVPELLAEAHIFLLSTRYEGVPMCVIEAMRAKLPVIATDVGGLHECVEDGKTGFLVRPGNIDQLRERIEALLTDPVRREQFGEAGRVRYEQRFRITPEEITARTMEIYRLAVSRTDRFHRYREARSG